MTAPISKKVPTDDTRLGVHSALQPLSGIRQIDETFAVSGLGRGGYVRKEEASKDTKRR